MEELRSPSKEQVFISYEEENPSQWYRPDDFNRVIEEPHPTKKWYKKHIEYQIDQTRRESYT